MFRKTEPAVQLKTPAQITRMREAGRLVAHTLDLLRSAAEPGMSTLDLDAVAEQNIRDAGAVPSFKGYWGFPGSVCTSVNEEVVHGIPRGTKKLRFGDIISVDCGAILDGWHGDSAITFAIGEVSVDDSALMRSCEEAMWQGIAQLRPGRHLGDIGHAIENHIRGGGYGNVQEYGGHGIGTEMHMDPHVLNYGKPRKGMRLVEGMCLAIEPMANQGTRNVVSLDDEWTVVTRDGRRSAHFEHSVAVTADGPLVLTAREENLKKISELGFPAPDG